MKNSILPLLFCSSMAFAQVATLSKVVDGDTVYFSNGDKCRIAYIDTPESSFNSKVDRDASKCNGLTTGTMVNAGKDAAKQAKSLLSVGTSYRYDSIGSDQYGRSICVLKLPNGDSFNLAMVRSGYAVAFGKYIDDNNVYRSFYGAMRDAKQNNVGLWGQKRPVMECMESIDR